MEGWQSVWCPREGEKDAAVLSGPWSWTPGGRGGGGVDKRTIAPWHAARYNTYRCSLVRQAGGRGQVRASSKGVHSDARRQPWARG